jgi:hypothetical protein
MLRLSLHSYTKFSRYALALSLLVAVFPLFAQEGKPLDVRSSVGDLHVGKDADAKTAGLPLYPGARPKREQNDDPLNFGIAMESFGLKIVVAKYESDDDPSKIIGFYRDKLKKYGKVLECHARDDNAQTDLNSDDKDDHSKELKCEGDNSGPVVELKAGTSDNQHVVAIEPRDDAKASTTFVIVYLHSRGKSEEI